MSTLGKIYDASKRVVKGAGRTALNTLGVGNHDKTTTPGQHAGYDTPAARRVLSEAGFATSGTPTDSFNVTDMFNKKGLAMTGLIGAGVAAKKYWGSKGEAQSIASDKTHAEGFPADPGKSVVQGNWQASQQQKKDIMQMG